MRHIQKIFLFEDFAGNMVLSEQKCNFLSRSFCLQKKIFVSQERNVNATIVRKCKQEDATAFKCLYQCHAH